MKRMYLAALTLAGVLLGQATAFADEGMWLIQDINAALEKKMQERGLKLSAGEIYNADAPGAAVSDAIVSLGFYCTGSIISDQGLLITNHHCAYSDVFALSTPEHNYLEEGYWAVRSDQELPIPDKQVFFLKRVLDVTAEVQNLRKELSDKGLPCGMRHIHAIHCEITFMLRPLPIVCITTECSHGNRRRSHETKILIDIIQRHVVLHACPH